MRRPRPPRHAYLAAEAPIALAHRGGGDPRYENTWRAFEDAIALGYRYIETDAQVTADGQVVLFHDDDLARVSDRPGRIGALPFREVRAARVGGTESIPLLADVLATWPDLRLNVDVKTDAVVAPFAEVIRRAGAHERVCVASFSDRRITRAARLIGDRACLSAGPAAVAALRLLAAVPGIARLPGGPLPDVVQVPDAVPMPLRAGRLPVLTRRFVDLLHARGILVHVWTVNDPARMGDLLDAGVDGVISDATADLKAVMQGRGQWAAG